MEKGTTHLRVEYTNRKGTAMKHEKQAEHIIKNNIKGKKYQKYR